ncbi:solute carrier family 7 member 13 [Ornithorhynchus anatinus]|uniref:Solute carrier family 7 member 13 n=1 Tax=Ornithorhynchus anatinus TaxID=9258 RepID=F7F3L7_ORNAN|nr:solute carrier family 7 member 13 [Ornithorhynchus anatinus]
MGKSIQLQRALGYFHGVSFLIGSMIGAGIFVTPKGVLKYSSLNVGVTLLIWGLSALASMMAALCYAELGTTFSCSGAQYVFLKRSLGSPFAFIYTWDRQFTSSATTAARTLLLAEYMTQPFYRGCSVPELSKKCLALAILWSLGILNARSVKRVSGVQVAITGLKLAVLGLIALSGLVLLGRGRKENTARFENAFGTELPGAVQWTEAFFQGLFAYSGWGILVHMAGELRNPGVNIPRCVLTAFPIVTVIYLLVNISYLTVLTPKEIVSSAAVAVTWADRVIPAVAWVIPVGVSASIFGSLLCSLFSASRLNYAASQEGHLPLLFSMLNVHSSPAPAVVQVITLASILIIPSDLISLINYLGFTNWIQIGLMMTGLIILRYREPHLPRPYKVFLPFAFGTVAISLFLILTPMVLAPKMHYVYVFLFILGGLLLYLPFVHFKIRFAWFDKITCHLQLLMNVSPPHGTDGSKTREATSL